MTTLQFAPFVSAVDSAFWHALSKRKLDEFGLKDEPVPICGSYTNSNAQGLSCLFAVEYTAFNLDSLAGHEYQVAGSLMNTNTIDQFKSCDKQNILRNSGSKIWQAIISGKALENPHLLNTFVLLTFANLKKYHYHYWFGFPALSPTQPVKLAKPTRSIKDALSPQQITSLLSEYDRNFKPKNIPYMVMHCKDNSASLHQLTDIAKSHPNLDELIFIFVDPSTLPEHPGWPMRNFLCLISRYFVKKDESDVRLLGLRDRTVNAQRDVSHSVYLETVLSPLAPQQEMYNVVGWEKNKQQKLLPRFVNMSKSMDPAALAESAVDLNLKLMRWRLLPELNLESISKAKCLLLGAGTLGCNVARNLLGWGVRNITLVDNSTVSFSNPVRQSLFTFNDCHEGGRPKAETAAESLKLIFPGVNAKGLSLSIPMPGHPVNADSIASVRSEVENLETLIEEHDAVFLLMDTRESRWLPSVVGAAKNKIVMTAALGFDSWLAMRHGSRVAAESSDGDGGASVASEVIQGDQLGCYYCNDVVAPRDSTKDRTLDQQCTVSRPGLSMMCSALIVELFVSLLQHPKRHAAPAYITVDEDYQVDQCNLGILPHQIRGYLSQYQIILPVGRKFANCTACSDTIVNHYREHGFEFLLRAFNDATHLEEISGLSQLQIDPLALEVLNDFDVEEDDW